MPLNEYLEGTFVVAVPGTDEIDAALAGYVKALARERTVPRTS